VTVHFAHRVLGVLTMLVLLAATVKLLAAGAPHVRRAAQAMAALVVLQVALGFGSVMTTLAVVPVSLHTLVAASLLSVTVLLATWGALPLRPAARRAFPERPGAARPAPAD
jgi:heme A synthase